MITFPSVLIYLPINKDEGDDNGYLEYMIYDDHSKCLNIFAINKDEGGDGGYLKYMIFDNHSKCLNIFADQQR